ncbi:DUF1064 domain-containing protein [Pseudomonas sp. S1(2024)]|uniref:DUF1064 domain-containing protein n=1 Tax=Pseudomonas sp. S1(2024) TaxID=3390191 RepID=UPI00397D7AC3
MSRLASPSSDIPANNRMSAAQFRELNSQAAKGKKGRNGKFNAIVITTSEGRFDSKMEYQRYLNLKLMLRAGEITDLQRQVPYELTAGGIHICTYVADFVYKKQDVTVVEDVKGFRTQEYRLKRRLMRDILGIEILETGRVRKPKKASP